MNPIPIPNKRRGFHTLLSPCRDVRIVDQIGTVATRSPARPELILVSAVVMRIQGPTISANAYGMT